MFAPMDSSRPLIVVCNDDSIFAPGIQALIEAVKPLGDLLVVAPDSPQSGMGHAITINSTLRVNLIESTPGLERYSCSGTPVDCIKMAVTHLAKNRKISLVVSGINHGSNSSINVIYSGTMSAAVEACIEGIPAIGFSLLDYSWEADFSQALPHVTQIAQKILTSGLPAGVCLNVNLPKGPVKGSRLCRQAHAMWVEEMDERTDPRGGKYYWLTGHFENMDQGTDTDEFALSEGYISIVPVQTDLTAYRAFTFLEENGFSQK
jgi:5'-nucleotidase